MERHTRGLANMSSELTAILIAATAYSVTNLDGIAVLIAVLIARPDRRGQVVFAYLLATSVVLGICFGVAALADLLPTVQWGWLGLIPLAMGIVELKRIIFPDRQRGIDRPEHGGIGKVVALVLAGSGDVVAVFAALFAESHNRPAVLMLMAAFASACLWCAVGLVLASKPRVSAIGQKVTSWLLPVIMIAAGLYILLDTTTDMH